MTEYTNKSRWGEIFAVLRFLSTLDIHDDADADDFIVILPQESRPMLWTRVMRKTLREWFLEDSPCMCCHLRSTSRAHHGVSARILR